MAVLQTLRDKLAIAITVIVAVALASFILTDLFSSASIFTSRDVVGVIDGEKIKYQEFMQQIQSAEDFAKMNSQSGTLSDEQLNQVREEVWGKRLHDITFGKVFENAGIEVSPEELLDMISGNHISPMLRQMFTNPQTGIYDRAFAENFVRSTADDRQAYEFWSNVEPDLIRNRLMAKYSSLLSNSLYCTKLQVESELALRAKNADAAFVSVRYSVIPDSTVAVSNSEIKDFYKKHLDSFKSDALRDIEYVSFPVRPSNQDRQDTREKLEAIKASFADAQTDPYRFAQSNSDAPVVERFLPANQLSSHLANFVGSAKEGDVCGPYFEGSNFKLSRIVKVAQRPDSVKARHILIQESQQLADSIFNLAKNGADFAELARQFSKDQGSAINGGDLGWFPEGQMVAPFNEACFSNPKGAIVMVNTQFGVHIINVQDRGTESTKYSFATIQKDVRYSNRTQSEVFNSARAFLAEVKDAKSFDAQVDSAHLVKRVGRGIRSNAQSINSLRHARDLVKWAFNEDTEVGDVSDLTFVDDEYVVAILTKAKESGYDDVEDVREMIVNTLRNDKKVALIAAQTQGKSLDQIAEAFNSSVDTAYNVSFASNSVTGAGMEPALVGGVINAEVGKVIPAVKGNNAVYAFSVLDKKDNQVSEDQVRTSYMQQLQSLQYVLTRMVYDVEIEDNRVNFF